MTDKMLRLQTLLFCGLAFLFIVEAYRIKLDSPLKCSSTCGGDKTIYNFKDGFDYTYKLNVISQHINDTGAKTVSKLSGEAVIQPLSNCEYILQINYGDLAEEKEDSAGNAFNQAKISNIYESGASLRFGMDNGKITAICPSTSIKLETLNLYRGFLSSLQITLDHIQGTSYHIERDIHGDCYTSYEIQESNADFIRIQKQKFVAGCANRFEIMSNSRGVAKSEPQERSRSPNIDGSLSCEINVNVRESTLQKSVCSESHTITPFGSNQGAKLQTLNSEFTVTFGGKKARQQTFTTDAQILSNLLFEPPFNPKTAIESIVEESLTEQPTADNTATLICQIAEQINSEDSASKYIELIYAMRKAKTVNELEQIYKKSVNDPNFCKDAQPDIVTSIFINALSNSKSPQAIEFALNNILTNSNLKLQEKYLNKFLFASSFVQNPSPELVKAFESIYDNEKYRGNALLASSSILSYYCSRNEDCFQNQDISNNFDKIYKGLNDACNSNSANQVIDYSKALGNIGQSKDYEATATLFGTCFNKFNDQKNVQLALLELPRKYSQNQSLKAFDDILFTIFNEVKDTNIKIKTYLLLMRQPCSCKFERFINYLENNNDDTIVNEQVASFIWSHLNSMAESTNPEKQKLKERFSLDDRSKLKELGKRFNLNPMSYSKYAENSMTLPFGNNIAANIEAYSVFGRRSYFPESLRFNMTLDSFAGSGESTNFLDITFNTENLEAVVDKVRRGYRMPGSGSADYAGQRGKASPPAVPADIIALAKSKDDPLTQRYGQPKISVSTKMFGNEILFRENLYNDFMDYYNKMDISSMLRGVKPIEWTLRTNALLMDNALVFPTSSGFSVSYQIVSSANLDMQMKLQLSFENGLSVQKKVSPKFSVYSTSRFFIDTYGSKFGLASEAMLHSNMSAENGLEAVSQISTAETGEKRKLKFFISPIKQRQNLFSIRKRNVQFLVNSKNKDVGNIRSSFDTNIPRNTFCTGPAIQTTFGGSVCFSYGTDNNKVNQPMSSSNFFLEASVVKFDGYILHLEYVPSKTLKYLPERFVVKVGMQARKEGIVLLEMKGEEKGFQVDLKLPFISKYSVKGMIDSGSVSSGSLSVDDIEVAKLKAFTTSEKMRVVIQDDKLDWAVLELSKKDAKTEYNLAINKGVSMKAIYIIERGSKSRHVLNLELPNKYAFTFRVANNMVKDEGYRNDWTLGALWKQESKTILDYNGELKFDYRPNVVSQLTGIQGKIMDVQLSHTVKGTLSKDISTWDISTRFDIFLSNSLLSDRMSYETEPYALEVNAKFPNQSPENEKKYQLFAFLDAPSRNNLNITTKFTGDFLDSTDKFNHQFIFTYKTKQDMAGAYQIPDVNLHVLCQGKPGKKSYEMQLLNQQDAEKLYMLSRFKYTLGERDVLLESTFNLKSQDKHKLLLRINTFSFQVNTMEAKSEDAAKMLLNHDIYVNEEVVGKGVSQFDNCDGTSCAYQFDYSGIKTKENKASYKLKFNLANLVFSSSLQLQSKSWDYFIETSHSYQSEELLSQFVITKDSKLAVGYNLQSRLLNNGKDKKFILDIYLGGKFGKESRRIVEFKRSEMNASVFAIRIPSSLTSESVFLLSTEYTGELFSGEPLSSSSKILVDFTYFIPKFYFEYTSKDTVTKGEVIKFDRTSQYKLGSKDNKPMSESFIFTLRNLEGGYDFQFTYNNDYLKNNFNLHEVKLNSFMEYKKEGLSKKGSISWRKVDARSDAYISYDFTSNYTDNVEVGNLYHDVLSIDANVRPESRCQFTLTNVLDVDEFNIKKLTSTISIEKASGYNLKVDILSKYLYVDTSRFVFFHQITTDNPAFKNFTVYLESGSYPNTFLSNALKISAFGVEYENNKHFTLSDAGTYSASMDWNSNVNFIKMGKLSVEADTKVKATLNVKDFDDSNLFDFRALAGKDEATGESKWSLSAVSINNIELSFDYTSKTVDSKLSYSFKGKLQAGELYLYDVQKCESVYSSSYYDPYTLPEKLEYVIVIKSGNRHVREEVAMATIDKRIDSFKFILVNLKDNSELARVQFARDTGSFDLQINAPGDNAPKLGISVDAPRLSRGDVDIGIAAHAEPYLKPTQANFTYFDGVLRSQTRNDPNRGGNLKFLLGFDFDSQFAFFDRFYAYWSLAESTSAAGTYDARFTYDFQASWLSATPLKGYYQSTVKHTDGKYSGSLKANNVPAFNFFISSKNEAYEVNVVDQRPELDNKMHLFLKVINKEPFSVECIFSIKPYFDLIGNLKNEGKSYNLEGTISTQTGKITVNSNYSPELRDLVLNVDINLPKIELKTSLDYSRKFSDGNRKVDMTFKLDYPPNNDLKAVLVKFNYESLDAYKLNILFSKQTVTTFNLTSTIKPTAMDLNLRYKTVELALDYKLEADKFSTKLSYSGDIQFVWKFKLNLSDNYEIKTEFNLSNQRLFFLRSDLVNLFVRAYKEKTFDAVFPVGKLYYLDVNQIKSKFGRKSPNYSVSLEVVRSAADTVPFIITVFAQPASEGKAASAGLTITSSFKPIENFNLKLEFNSQDTENFIAKIIVDFLINGILSANSLEVVAAKSLTNFNTNLNHKSSNYELTHKWFLDLTKVSSGYNFILTDKMFGGKIVETNGECEFGDLFVAQSGGSCGFDYDNGNRLREIRMRLSEKQSGGSNYLISNIVAWDKRNLGFLSFDFGMKDGTFVVLFKSPIRNVDFSLNAFLIEFKFWRGQAPEEAPRLISIVPKTLGDTGLELKFSGNYFSKEFLFRYDQTKPNKEYSFELVTVESNDKLFLFVLDLEQADDFNNLVANYQLKIQKRKWNGKFVHKSNSKVYWINFDIQPDGAQVIRYELYLQSLVEFRFQLGESVKLISEIIQEQYTTNYKLSFNTKPDDSGFVLTLSNSIAPVKYSIDLKTATKKISFSMRSLSQRSMAVSLYRFSTQDGSVTDFDATFKRTLNKRLVSEIKWNNDIIKAYKKIILESLDSEAAARTSLYYRRRSGEISSQTQMIFGKLFMSILDLGKLMDAVKSIVADTEALQVELAKLYEKDDFYIRTMLELTGSSNADGSSPMSSAKSQSNAAASSNSRGIKDIVEAYREVVQNILDKISDDSFNTRFPKMVERIVKSYNTAANNAIKMESRARDRYAMSTGLFTKIVDYFVNLISKSDLGFYMNTLQTEFMQVVVALDNPKLKSDLVDFIAQTKSWQLELEGFQKELSRMRAQLFIPKPKKDDSSAAADQSSNEEDIFTSSPNYIKINLPAPQVAKRSGKIAKMWSSLMKNFMRSSGSSYWTSPNSAYLRSNYLMQTYGSRKKIMTLMPPYKSVAYVGKKYFVTFDGLTGGISPTCQYLLVRDFRSKSLTMVMTMDSNLEKMKVVVSTMDGAFELQGNGVFSTIDEKQTTKQILPYMLDTDTSSLRVYRKNNFVSVVHNLFTLELQVQLGVWRVSLEGRLHGAVDGLLGSNNFHADDDLNLPHVGLKRSASYQEHAQAWAINCNSASVPEFKGYKSSQSTCTNLFSGNNSPYKDCFGAVNPRPFLAICNDLMSNDVEDTACKMERYYTLACSVSGVLLRPTTRCYLCNKKDFNFNAVTRNRFIFVLDTNKCVIKENLDFIKNLATNLDKDHQKANKSPALFSLLLYNDANVKTLTMPYSSFVGELSDLNTVLDTRVNQMPEKCANMPATGRNALDATFEAIKMPTEIARDVILLFGCDRCQESSQNSWASIKRYHEDERISMHYFTNQPFKNTDNIEGIFGLDLENFYRQLPGSTRIVVDGKTKEMRPPKDECSSISTGSQGVVWSIPAAKINVPTVSERVMKLSSKSTGYCKCLTDSFGSAYGECR